MKKETRTMDIDLVYLWVDGNDPAWQAKRNAFIGVTDESSSTNCKGRYANNDELKYSLRSVEMYAPWIRKVFIVTDGQTPEWLDTLNPKVRIVDLTEIMPAECLPCFNSSLIEKFFHNIPELAEHFLYANDDMFINKEASINDFFTTDGFPIVRLIRKPLRRLSWFLREKIRKKPLNNYRKTITYASLLVYKKYGNYYTGMPHHNIDAYLKSDCKRIAEKVLRNEFLSNRNNRKRSDDDIQRIIYSYIALAEKRGKLRYVTPKESIHISIHREDHYKKLKKNHPLLFCMNDSEYAQDYHRKTAKEFIQEQFPNKSEFEK